jgi:tetratricopeptide (TPR) repeat protein
MCKEGWAMLSRCPRFLTARASAAAIAAVTLSSGLALRVPSANAAEMKGAQEIIQAIQEALAGARSAAAQPDAAVQAVEQLRRDLDAFAIAQDDLPAAAATAWLGLWDRAAVLYDRQTLARLAGRGGPLLRGSLLLDPSDSGALAAALAVLPDPDAWPILAERVAARPPPTPANAGADAALHLLVAFLNQDPAAMLVTLDRYGARIDDLKDWQRDSARQRLATLRGHAEALGAGRTSDLVARFEQTIAAQKGAAVLTRSLRVPELVGLAGEAKAEALLREALAIPGVRLTIPGQGATLALAQRVALSLAGTLKTPQWELVDSPAAWELYEAMAKQFPTAPDAAAPRPGLDAAFLGRYESYPAQEDHRAAQGREAAALYYLLSLLRRGQPDDAVAFAAQLGQREGFTWRGHAWGGADAWGSATAWVEPAVLLDFYSRLVRQTSPGAEQPWREYALLSTQLGKGEEAVQALEQACAQPGLSSAERTSLQEQLVTAYLAHDDADRAVALLRQEGKEDWRRLPPEERDAALGERLEQGTRLARLGKLLGKPEWIEEGIQVQATVVAGALTELSAGKDDALACSLRLAPSAKLLVENGRYAEAEARLLAVVSATATLWQNSKGDGESVPPFVRANNPLRPVLVQLADVYHAAGRPQDLLILLETSPWWGAADLLHLAKGTWNREEGLLYTAAAALHAVGRDAEAIPILKELLVDSPSNDRAYELLLATGDKDLLAWLDRLYERDRFEERPLIWKAVLQRQAGQLTEAEATVRQALKVDPTDGEQKAGDRARAYTVLADILQAQARTEDAQFFRNLVQAVRLAEQGDEYAAAGLTTRSLGFYERASTVFLDAYCVQWRLAERLYALGDRKGAEAHYRVAFERLPEQFGQVASLCFGCDGVFSAPQSRGIAEEVLIRLEKEGPKRPQVLYLLGMLRQAQGRSREAYDNYRRATAMDPGYLDAWGKAFDLAEGLFLPPAERDAMALTMLRLDPLQRHVTVRLEEITHLQALAVVLRANRRFSVPRPAALLPLPASRTALADAARASPRLRDLLAAGVMETQTGELGRDRVVPRLGEVLVWHEVVQAILSLGLDL